MLRTFLTKCNNDRVASLIEKLNIHHESQQHLHHTMCEQVSEVHDHFTTFVTAMKDKYPNWKFWNDFVSLNTFAYIALFASIRSGNWNLRLASIKLIAPVFSAFYRRTYRKLLPQHLADCLLLPSEIQEQFTQGRFVVSITGRSWYSVGFDEAYEMLINKDSKSAVIHPNKEFISRKALYFPSVQSQ